MRNKENTREERDPPPGRFAERRVRLDAEQKICAQVDQYTIRNMNDGIEQPVPNRIVAAHEIVESEAKVDDRSRGRVTLESSRPK